MTTFDEREKGFERKFAHDEQLRFKATARRNKLFGLWAAGLMGLSGEEAQDYAKSVVKADFEGPGGGGVLRKVRADLQAKGIDQPEQQLESTLIEFMTEAVSQIQADSGAKS